MSAKIVLKKRLRPLLFYPRILTFHKISPQFTFGSTNFSPRRFDHLIKFLIDKGFNPISLEKAVIGTGERSLAVTFDDGYQHLIEYLPLFIDKYHLSPTIFVLTGYIGHTNRWDYTHFISATRHLDVNDIKKLAGQGVTFGSHGHRHCDLTACSGAQLRTELTESKKILEDIIGTEVRHLSYPFGRFNERVTEEARAAGYQFGFTMDFPTDTINDRLTIGRIPVYGFDSQLAIFQKICGGPLYRWEKFKSNFTHRLAAGTVILNKIRSLK